MEIANDEMRHLLRVAESHGWDTAFYDYCKAQVASGGTVPEDPRVADWRYLLPLNRDTRALVLGCGWGAVPIALAETCGTVFAADPAWEKIAFLNVRRRQQRIDNLYPVHVRDGLDLPFAGNYFDMVSVRGFQWRAAQSVRVRDVVRRVHGLLREGGIAYLSLGNRLGFQHLFRQGRNGSFMSLHTIYGYRRILQAEGFAGICFYAPLPHYEGIPLFYVPLEEAQALNFFFRNLFPLFEMVSPEVKQAHAFQYAVAKMGVRLALLFKLTSLTKGFFPGFSVIAKKATQDMDMIHAP